MHICALPLFAENNSAAFIFFKPALNGMYSYNDFWLFKCEVRGQNVDWASLAWLCKTNVAGDIAFFFFLDV